MKPSHSAKSAQNRTFQPLLENLEQRLVPGETLAAALPLSTFVCPYLALLDSDVIQSDLMTRTADEAVAVDGSPSFSPASCSTPAGSPAATEFALPASPTSEPAASSVASASIGDACEVPITPLTPSWCGMGCVDDVASSDLAADLATTDSAVPAAVRARLLGSMETGAASTYGGTLLAAFGAPALALPSVFAATGAPQPAPSSAGPDAALTAAAAVLGAGGRATPLLVAHPVAAPGKVSLNSATPLTSGLGPYTPTQIRRAYGFNLLPNQGAGQTIWIVDAFNDPNIASDLATFDSTVGMPAPPSFTVVKAQGFAFNNTSWGLEESLDVEWAHSIAPYANIVLDEAAVSADSYLLGAVNYATNNGAHIVSMSWGTTDGSGDSSMDSTFNHPGVSYVAAAGDAGGVVIYPSSSPYVLSVGGTTLPLDANGARVGAETAWSSGGGGASKYESEPTYQTNYHISLTGRGTPDVSYDANPNTGVYVYDSYLLLPGWYEVGGTSAGAPQWSALIAMADQYRSTPLSTNSLTSRSEYNAATGSVYSTNYHDITSGSNGYPAATGYDLATGLGSPQAKNLVGWLVNNN